MSLLINQVMVTIVAPLSPGDVQRAQSVIDTLGNPPTDAVRAKLDQSQGDAGIHFMSLHALPSFTAGRAHLILEFSADGDQARAITQMATALEAELSSVFELARDWSSTTSLERYLTRHVIKIGVGLGATPGLAFAGTPGLGVGQILADAKLAEDVTAKLAAQPRGLSALGRLAAVRASFAPDNACVQTPAAVAPFTPATTANVVRTALGSFVATYLWPIVLIIVLLALWHGVHVGFRAVEPPEPWRHPHLADHLHESLPGQILLALIATVAGLIGGSILLLVGTLGAAVVMYLRLRKLETTDWVNPNAPDHATLHALIARENVYAHNHMMSMTQLKPGWLRYFLVRLVFWAIGLLAGKLYKPGHLGSIGTIHFARWITVPGTRDFIFFSNFGGSWESYLEDFITLASDGLTGVWSNAVGFPRTSNLIKDGATDGERFKRFARQSMLPTRFWYSAYPTLTTDTIRRNAMIRRGLSAAMTEDDAIAWLSAFGSAARPQDMLVSSEIQSLLFGGLGFLPHGVVTLWHLPAETSAARAWLRDVTPFIAFNDGRHVRDDPNINAAVQFAVSRAGLKQLGLPDAGLQTFPAAFLDDMTAPMRARIIGDEGTNARSNWWWGQTPLDVALLIYGESPAAVSALEAKINALSQGHGAVCPPRHRIPLEPVAQLSRAPHTEPATNAPERKYFGTEPFGFADGVSQPVIRGTYKGQKNADPLHLVSPGEFILGYPDNRNNMPPGPVLDALHDPANMLPVVGSDSEFATNTVNHPRDLGRNGSFLVIRQLEQDVEGFSSYCTEEASRLEARFAPPYVVTPEFIGAKLVGRWKNGSPLVRAAYSPSHAPEIITENGFTLGSEDPEGLRCPFGAHIRRTNPRDSLMPGSDVQISITNRHRILRVGRKYAAQADQKPGLLFMCLNGDIERQFEFIQQTWALSPNFMALSGEQDALLGDGCPGHNGFTVPTRDGPVKLKPMAQFVTMRGGGYFFLPGKRLITYLSQAPTPSAA